jgi:serine/threonine-protein kinase
MIEFPPTRNPSLPLEVALRLNAVCDRFEAAWKAALGQGGQPPRIETYLDDVRAAERPVFLRELVLLDVAYRKQRGKTMRIDLTVTAGPHAGRVFTFEGHDTFLVGRSKRAHFRLSTKDRYFSRIHFLVEVNPPQCRLMDMASRNGTFVNGARVKTIDLKAGDRIRAGRTILRVFLKVGAEGPAPLPETVPELPGPKLNAQPAPVSPPAPDLPRPIPGYQIVRELGRGGMGIVYLARRSADQKPVALKTIVPAVKGSRVAIDRFLREAKILQSLDHPYIVSFHEMGEADGRLYFAMEFVPGTDANRLLKEHGPLPVGRAVGLIGQLLQALEYAHAKRFVHRDIKSANLLIREVSRRDVVKLADFGLARVYQASALSGLTLSGDVGGTVAFMAPEQIVNFREAAPPADLYSAAATLYNLLTDRYVFDFPRGTQERLQMILEGTPVPIRHRRPDVPKSLAALIHRCLAKEPAERPDAPTLRKALLKFCP